MKFKLLCVTALCSGAMAFAAEGGGGSEYFYKVPAGKSAVTPSLTYGTGSFKTAADAKVKASGMVLGVDYGYGLMDGVTLGANVAYDSLTTKVDGAASNPKTTGLSNLNLYGNAQTDLGFGLLHYGAVLSLSPGNSKTKTNGDMNAYTGGHSLTPYVGLSVKKDKCTFGGKLSYGLNIGDRTSEDAAGTKTKASGMEQTKIAVMYEHDLDAAKVGGELSSTTTADSKDKDSGAKTKQNSPITNLKVYGVLAAGKDMEVIPEFNYATASSTDYKSYSSMSLGAALRMLF